MHHKTKNELDKLTKTQINDHRVRVLSQSKVSKDDTRYFKEIDLYLRVRFKEDVLAQYEKWFEQKNDKTIDGIDREAMKFISDIIEKMGREEFYQFSIGQDREKLGEMQFIKI